jgi:hypothetical protein
MEKFLIDARFNEFVVITTAMATTPKHPPGPPMTLGRGNLSNRCFYDLTEPSPIRPKI